MSASTFPRHPRLLSLGSGRRWRRGSIGHIEDAAAEGLRFGELHALRLAAALEQVLALPDDDGVNQEPYHALKAVGPARPAVAAKGNVAAWWRHASWLGDGRIAVTGHYEPPLRAGRRPQPLRPFGARLIDTRDWTIRTLHPDAMLIHRAGERLLANGTVWHAGAKPDTSTGLLAFDMQGRRAFTRFRGTDVSVLGTHGRLAYVWVRPTRMLHVLDLRSGESLRRQRVGPARLPFLFSASDAMSGS